MSPREVHGLQALAMAHGGSLTINPQTGLPEAGFLQDILPAVAGFALNAFAPGVGEAVGGLFGLGGAAGTALTVGGISGLASGSLEKGIMAGMGAYGGAGLGGSLGDMGSAVNARAANEAAQVAGLGDAERVAAIQAAAKPDISAGFSAAASAPKDFLQDNKYLLGAAFLPAIAGGLGDKDEGTGAPARKKYNMKYARDPVTGALYDTSGEGVTYGGVGRPTIGMAEGGPVPNPMMDIGKKLAIAGMQPSGRYPGAGLATVDPYDAGKPDTRSDSEKAYDYLMGVPGAKNPMLFTHESTSAIKPADMLTRKGGHYVLDAATNTYTWVPDAEDANAAAASLAAKEGLAALDRRGGGRGDTTPQDKARTDALFDSYESQDRVFGLPIGTTAAEARTKDMKSLANLAFNPLTSIYGALKDAFMGPQAKSMSEITPLKDALHDESDAGVTTGKSIADMAEAEGFSLGPQATGFSTGKPGETAVGGTGVAPTGGRSIADMAESEGVALGPAATGDVGVGGGYGGNDGMGEGFGGIYARGGSIHMATGGLGDLGGYSDGGQLLRGPGNGVSDSIPARIAGNQPARLADGEFVVPARIVSELGNGSTDAGARELYKMMARIQAGRAKTVGKNKTAVDSKSARHLPA
jgi:hypothetical protein